MRYLLTSVAMVWLAGCATAQTNTPQIQGTGNWGAETNGLTCRVTTDRGEYTISEPVSVLVGVRNAGRQPVRFGMAEVHLTAIQGDRDKPPYFFSTTLHEFPEKTAPRDVFTLAPGEVCSRTVVVRPWGPTYSSIPAVASPGTMTIEALFVYRPDASSRGKAASSATIQFTAKK